MLENKQTLPEDGELSDADLNLVSGGDQKQPPKPKPKTPTTSNGFLKVPDIKGPSTRDGHEDE